MVETLADRIIAAIAEPYHIDKTEIRIGVSIGCAFGPIDGADASTTSSRRPTSRSTRPRTPGRGICRYFSPTCRSEQEDRVRLEQRPARRRSRSSSSTCSTSRWSTPPTRA